MAINWQAEYHRYSRYFVDVGRFYKMKKARVYTGLVLSLFTVSFFLFFAIKPTLTTIAQLTKTISDQKIVYQKLAEKISNLEEAQIVYNNLAPDLYLLDEALPKTPELASLIKQIEALSRLAGVNLNTISFSPVSIKKSKLPGGETPIVSIVEFTLLISGDYPQLKSFIKSTSSLRRIILVDSFGFKSGSSDGEKSTDQGLRLNINGKAYFMEPIAEKTRGEIKKP